AAGVFQNVVCDGAIEHFTPDEIYRVLSNVGARLTHDGALSGDTIVEKVDGKSGVASRVRVQGQGRARAVPNAHLENITVFEAIYPECPNSTSGRPVAHCRSGRIGAIGSASEARDQGDKMRTWRVVLPTGCGAKYADFGTRRRTCGPTKGATLPLCGSKPIVGTYQT